ncbi:MAG: cobyrinate a,c-diamide synthase [Verrucomicrobiae bacterium]
MIPRLVIAGTQSGAGKTSISLGLVAAFCRRGLRVQTFKVGPDYLDPTYLALASGRPCYNLDGWMTGEGYLRDLFANACADADLAVIEGVMGLFDGADPEGLSGSTAEVAVWLDAPVVLVANAHGAGRSFAATAHGFATFLPEVRLAGVIANRCGSARHAEGLRTSLSAASLPPLLGAVRRGALPELPSRHLGLVSADEKQLTRAMLDELAEGVGSAISLDQVLQFARSARPLLPRPAISGRSEEGTKVRLGIARDEAFHFYYPDNLEALEREGCELVPFSPLHDGGLPDNLDGIYIGGGYPEEHAQELSANDAMCGCLRQFAESRRTIYAECGGLMYLSQGIETLDGIRHPMVGILPAWTRMCTRRKSLGYVEVTLTRETLWGDTGDVLRGHEFHYSELSHPPAGCVTAYELSHRRSGHPAAEGFQSGSVLASYAHLHFASCAKSVRHFVSYLKSSHL